MTPLDSSFYLGEPLVPPAGADALVPLRAYDRLVAALDACRAALAECRSTYEVKEIHNQAAALKAYARQAKDKTLEADACEIRFRAERRLGEMIVAQKATVGLNRGMAGTTLSGSAQEPLRDNRPTLAEAGIDKKLSMRAQRLAKLGEADFEAAVNEAREKIAAVGRESAPLDNLTANIEWFTDPEWLKRVRAAMGGIDLDPASCEFAQRTVQATEWFDKKRDGLAKPWHGRIYLNPPFARGLIDKFIDKLISERPSYNQAIVLVNSQTETAWFQRLGKIGDAVAFPKGRVVFYNERTSQQNPVFGSAFVYIGDRRDAFVDAFKRDCLILAGGLGRG